MKQKTNINTKNQLIYIQSNCGYDIYLYPNLKSISISKICDSIMHELLHTELHQILSDMGYKYDNTLLIGEERTIFHMMDMNWTKDIERKYKRLYK